MIETVIVGAGDLGIQLLHHITNHNHNVNVIGWIDDTKQVGSSVSGKTVLGGLNAIDEIADSTYFALAIGYKNLQFKDKLVNKLRKDQRRLYSFIHPSSIIDKSCLIDEGAIVYAGCILDKDVRISTGVILNNGVIISHNTQIGSSTFIAPGVVVSGNVFIGSRCFLGAGAILKDGIKITDDVLIGSGSNVHKNITKEGVYIHRNNQMIRKHDSF